MWERWSEHVAVGLSWCWGREARRNVSCIHASRRFSMFQKVNDARVALGRHPSDLFVTGMFYSIVYWCGDGKYVPGTAYCGVIFCADLATAVPFYVQ